jgi:hypothetical protein
MGTHLGEFLSELLQPRVVVRFDDIVVVVEFAEVEGLLDHLAVFREAGVVFLGWGVDWEMGGKA